MAGDAINKFKNSLNRGITTISVKTSSSLEKSKIKTHIDSLHKEIEKLTFDAGQLVYQMWENGQNDSTRLGEYFVEIRKKKEEIAQLNEELVSIDERDNEIFGANMTGKCICPNCKTEYDSQVNFCRICGTNMQGR